MADNATNLTNSTVPSDSLLGLADRRTESLIILAVIVIVVGILVLISVLQQRSLRPKR